MAPSIGTLAERSRHAARKASLAAEGDALEYAAAGFVVDILRPPEGPERPSRVIEIQTRSLGKLKRKLAALLDRYEVQVVHPIATERVVVREDAQGSVLGRRRSPKRGSLLDLFSELVGLGALVRHPRLSVLVLLVREEEVRVDDGRGSRRRRFWSVRDRRLLDVLGSVALRTPSDYAALLPPALPEPFDTAELADALGQPRFLARQMAYCLRQAGAIEEIGRRVNARVYRRVAGTTAAPRG
jgi:hypothetical protein